MVWIGLLLVLLTLIGTPLFVIIAAVAMLGLHAADYDLAIVAAEFFRITELPVLIAIPLFTIAGYLLGESKAPQRLVRLTDALFGWMPGGLAIVALVSCALFTAFTGATGVTIVARPAGRPGEKPEHGSPLFSRRYGQSTGVVRHTRFFRPSLGCVAAYTSDRAPPMQ